MDSKIFQNSYVIFGLAFCSIYLTFYLFGIGYVTTYEDDKPVRQVGWRYPLGLSIIIWVFWHYCMYPSESILNEGFEKKDVKVNRNPIDSPFRFEPKQPQTPNMRGGFDHAHKMDMRNWI